MYFDERQKRRSGYFRERRFYVEINWAPCYPWHAATVMYIIIVRMENRSNMCLFDKRQFDFNVLLFTPCLTV